MKKTNLLMKMVLTVSAVFVVVLFQNCGSHMSTKSSDHLSVTEAPGKVEEDLRPLLSCTITDSTGRILRRISNISNSDETFASISEGEDISFDCSSSLDYTGKYNITNFAVNFSEGIVSNSTGLFQYKFKTAGTYTVEFTIKDKVGNTLKKIIRVLVKCSAMAGSTLSINSAAVNATAHIVPGFFTYTAQGAVSGGKPPYDYAWDFNGDAIIDNQPVDNDYINWQVWSREATAIPVHNLYSNLRKINLTIKDSCNFTKTISKDIQFDLPRIPANEFPTLKPYYYLQADIKRTSALSSRTSINRATSVDFNSIGSPAAPDINVREHVICRYLRDKTRNLAGLTVIGQNTYGGPNLVDSNQSLAFYMDQIVDNGAMGVAVNRLTFPVERMSYDIAQSQEVMTPYRFDKDATCSMEIKVERGETNIACSQAPNIFKTQVVITGQGSCSNMYNSFAGSISAENIKFFCTQTEEERCPPGVIVGGPDPIGY